MSREDDDQFRLPLDRYDTTKVRTLDAAYELALSCFPGLLQFTFTPATDLFLASAHVQLNSVRIGTVKSSGHDIRLVDDDRLAALAPINGTIEVSRGTEVRVARPPDIIVVGTGERITKLSPDYLGIKVTFPVEEVWQRMQRLAQSHVRNTLAGPGFPSSHLAESLKRYTSYLLEELDRPGHLLNFSPAIQSASTLLVDLVAGHWLNGQPHADGQPLKPSNGQLRRAESFILANATSPISIADVADAAGVSVRSLQLAFRSNRAITPRAFIANVRLQRIRVLLEQAVPGATVTEIASSAGITHLGRFARQYLLAFGEFPSETLHRAQLKRG